MSYRQILNDIQNNDLKRVYLIYGKENYLIDWIVNEIKEKYIDKNFETLNYVHLDGKEVSVDSIINACETLPFMSDKKIVVIENLVFLTGGKTYSKEEEQRLNEYICNISSFVCLIFIVREEKIDNRKRIIKNIKDVGIVVELSKIKGDDLVKWVYKMFSKYNKNITKKNISYFIENTVYSEFSSDKTLYDLENEIIKICNYLGDRKEVTTGDIDKVLIRSLENNIFKLVDSIGQKRTDKALTLLNEMILNNEPIQLILYMVIKQIRLLFMTKLLEGKGYSQGVIAQKLGVQNFVVKKLIEQSRNFRIEELQSAFERCLKVDEDIKRGEIESRLALEMLIVEFSKK
ncbi:DNA polymerase III delta subunit [Caloranaerobacter azorensis H53214]|uniref:DNA polymerase III subunit delta n=1 Tax=Caloranaerobacter azorensis H53214 TaxID=1156417 RepID=A0A096DQ19_9FIRM|nr:DNA polymerase III subunit delta [Caloranaerobacter azorensis]KGG81346.1 DNA polymerase III delta subunit [Caloranaerobacter azorensis H53214]